MPRRRKIQFGVILDDPSRREKLSVDSSGALVVSGVMLGHRWIFSKFMPHDWPGPVNLATTASSKTPIGHGTI